jgi:uncharacterized protein (DUF433 family)
MPPDVKLEIRTEPPPLINHPDGEVRVVGTRMPLHAVIQAWEGGDSPEAIVAAFDVLKLADVYAIIGYYLRHKDEVGVYLEARERFGEEVLREVEARFPSDGLRERLLARRRTADTER